MIFATVGTQLPFDRMVEALDHEARRLSEDVFIQTGPTRVQLEWARGTETVEPDRFEELVQSARVLVSHAGIGSILMAAAHIKPLIIVPRRKSLGEHRNDHQLATARKLESREGIYVAWQVSDVSGFLSEQTLVPVQPAVNPMLQDLIERIRNFI